MPYASPYLSRSSGRQFAGLTNSQVELTHVAARDRTLPPVSGQTKNSRVRRLGRYASGYVARTVSGTSHVRGLRDRPPDDGLPRPECPARLNAHVGMWGAIVQPAGAATPVLRGDRLPDQALDVVQLIVPVRIA